MTEEYNAKTQRCTKKTKCVQLDKETVSSNVPQRYNTCSQKSHRVGTVQISDLNLSESKKRKQNDENHTSSKKDNNLRKKRRIMNTNSQNDNMDECNNISQEDNNENVENETVNMDECLKLFNINISNGPVYVCSLCLQTWFRRSVYNIEFIKVSSQVEEEKLNQCRRYYISAENKEWICIGCRDCIKTGKIPQIIHRK